MQGPLFETTGLFEKPSRLFDDLNRKLSTLLDTPGPAVDEPGFFEQLAQSAQKLTAQRKPNEQAAAPPQRTVVKKRLDLSTINPALSAVGLDLVERMMPRYITKAGLACERMQHAGLPVSFITQVLEAVFVTQDEEQLREAFHYFDVSGDGFIDEDEYIAIAPLLGEDVPGDSLAAVMAAIDTDNNGTVTCDEFVHYVRTCNPQDEHARDGWRAMLRDDGDADGADGGEQRVMLNVARSKEGKKGFSRWRKLGKEDVAELKRGNTQQQRLKGEVAVRRADLLNAQSVVDSLRALRMGDSEVMAVVKALFVDKTNEAYATVFDIFDTDSTGGIDQHEFHHITALLGNHTSEQETRALFLAADRDCNGLLDVEEFTALLKTISPAAHSDDAHYVRSMMARERLQQRIGERAGRAEEQGVGASVTCKVLVLGPSRAGKTHLLNQVVSEKLPKGKTLTVGFSALQMKVGQQVVAIQAFDAPGDPKFASLSRIFHGAANFAMLVFDATSVASFEAIDALRVEFLEANPQYDAGRLVVVGNLSRSGVKRAISSGFARDWCDSLGNIAYFEVDAEASQGLLEPMRYIATEYLSVSHAH